MKKMIGFALLMIVGQVQAFDGLTNEELFKRLRSSEVRCHELMTNREIFKSDYYYEYIRVPFHGGVQLSAENEKQTTFSGLHNNGKNFVEGKINLAADGSVNGFLLKQYRTWQGKWELFKHITCRK